MARVALWRAGVPFDLREHVCALVRFHQVPFFGITKEPREAERLALRLSLLLRNDWLAAVAEADGRGRRCADPADQVRIVDHCGLWVEHCREHGVLETARAFATPHTRRVWCESDGLRSPDVPAHDDTTCEATLLCGLPASGKDSWLREHAPELPVISLDAVRDELDVEPGDSPGEVIALARERARELLRAGTSFAWNATNLSRDLRTQLLGFFRSSRARTRIVYCETSPADQRQRNRAREAVVPARILERMLERWTVPDPTEAHAIVFATHAAATPGGPAWPPTP
jgi:predicted kinase